MILRLPARRIPPSVRAWSAAHSVLLAAVATFAMHLLFLSWNLTSDEGGYAFVARFWSHAGDYLYGPQWVDRPPGLIGTFALAGLAGPIGVRLTAGVFAVVIVVAISDAARTIGGPVAARWSAWTAFALASSTLLGSQSLDGEIAAGAFVSICVAATLRATTSEGARRAGALAALAGAAAAAAVLMKQNFVDGFAFAGVLLGIALLSGREARGVRLTRPRAIQLGLTFLAGAAIPAGAALIWASAHGGVDALVYAMYGFRADAAVVMDSWSFAAPLHRLKWLVVFAVTSGLLALLVHLAYHHRTGWRQFRPLPWAVTAATAVALVGIAGGGNFWSHYLLALVPMVSLVAGFGARLHAKGHLGTRRLVALAVVVTAVHSPWVALTSMDSDPETLAVAGWVADSAQATDSLTVPFTHASVLYASGLAPAYPYSWSLPVRTLDPDLTLLASTLNGPAAPTWVVQWDGWTTWGLDAQGLGEAALSSNYQQVAVVCGHDVWLHNGVQRDLAPVPADSECGGS